MSIEKILYEHRYRDVSGDYETAPYYKHIGCSCGWEQNIAGMSGWRSWRAAHEAHLADLIRAELTGDDTAEALAHWMAADFALRSGKYVDWRYLDYSSRSILGALAERLVGK